MGGFRERKKATYFKIKDGNIEVSNGRDQEPIITSELYDVYLTKIEYKKNTVNINGADQEIESWQVYFRDDGGVDPETGEVKTPTTYVWTIGYLAVAFQSFINSMLSLRTFRVPFTFAAYEKNHKTRIWLTQNDTSIRWHLELSQLPKITEVVDSRGKLIIDQKTKKPLLDYDARMEWVHSVVAELNKRIADENAKYNNYSEDDGGQEFAQMPEPGVDDAAAQATARPVQSSAKSAATARRSAQAAPAAVTKTASQPAKQSASAALGFEDDDVPPIDERDYYEPEEAENVPF